MRKQIFFFLLFLPFFGNAQQHQNVQLYAYEQPVIPGAQKAKNIDGDEAQRSADETGAKYNYFFYAVSSAPVRMYPVELWVKGKKYGVRLKTVASPVVLNEGQSLGVPKTTELVPKTGSKVLQLIPMDVIAGKNYPTAAKLAGQNALVFVFRLGGKFYYHPLPELRRLGAVSLQ